MVDVISLVERRVVTKGLDKEALPKEELIKNLFFEEDYKNLDLLENIEKINFYTKRPTLFYPGCGADILNPLIYLEKLFPEINGAEFVFVDVVSNLGLIKTILDEIGVSFREEGETISFYWKNKLINLEFIEGNVFQLELPDFDIYFEKAFRIMKENSLYYEEKIFEKLSKNGLVISDSGFRHLRLNKLLVPQKLSSYEEMIIALKH
jgi:hypothetical protein